MGILDAIIIAIIEGLTEFLPVSSTGHMVIASSLMGIKATSFVKLFEVVIQLGAILSVVLLYWKRFFQSMDFYFKLLIGFIPAIIFGLLFKKHIDAMLENPTVIAIILLAGGVVLLFVDDWFAKNESPTNENGEQITYQKAFFIGCFQVLAMLLPGLSRSAATIIGGLAQGMTRKAAAEFAFFLAVPTMTAASLKESYDFYKEVKTGAIPALTSQDWTILAVGNIVAFVVAMAAIRFFIGYLTKYGFKVFGYYRIAIGLLLLIMQAAGVALSVH
ncbi:MAG: Undecaprenyl-diphosphatase [Bacteroidota bacterium]|jgi:undecaprenyl-diphosphatase